MDNFILFLFLFGAGISALISIFTLISLFLEKLSLLKKDNKIFIWADRYYEEQIGVFWLMMVIVIFILSLFSLSLLKDNQNNFNEEYNSNYELRNRAKEDQKNKEIQEKIIQLEKIKTSCLETECSFQGRCVTLPRNAHCVNNDPNNAWLCDRNFIESGNICIKKPDNNIPINNSISCNAYVKGNVTFSTGEKLYHVPGCENYYEVVINSAYGERYFCSEQEARSAGWRKAWNCP